MNICITHIKQVYMYHTETYIKLIKTCIKHIDTYIKHIKNTIERITTYINTYKNLLPFDRTCAPVPAEQTHRL